MKRLAGIILSLGLLWGLGTTVVQATGGVLSTRAIQALDTMFSGDIRPFSFPVVSSCSWTNANVVALGASLTGDVTCFSALPAKTVVKNAYIVITGPAAGVTTLSAAVGRTGAAYIDYIVASDAKAAANTVYGDVVGERGTNLTGYDLPSYTATTAVKIHFISTVQNLNLTTGSTGIAVFETAAIP